MDKVEASIGSGGSWSSLNATQWPIQPSGVPGNGDMYGMNVSIDMLGGQTICVCISEEQMQAALKRINVMRRKNNQQEALDFMRARSPREPKESFYVTPNGSRIAWLRVSQDGTATEISWSVAECLAVKASNGSIRLFKTGKIRYLPPKATSMQEKAMEYLTKWGWTEVKACPDQTRISAKVKTLPNTVFSWAAWDIVSHKERGTNLSTSDHVYVG